MRLRLLIVLILAALGITGFMSLGIWQVQRLHWKLDLIERVEARIHAAPVPAPGPNLWPTITRETDEYTRVTLTGSFLNDDTVLIYTPSDFGPGMWVLTPLRLADSTIVMINRGVVPQDHALSGDFSHVEGETTVTGLLRITEDKGWLFSQDNDPANGKWYRRDIASITSAKGFDQAAPYFVDQELTAPTGWPRGGQTVVSFRNAHLSYALTWFALAAVVALGAALVLRHELRRKP
ncbi:SURF1 family protein [Celeribacter sp. SCSIO 80788]|uniref:SURF1 family protein n=1 Tax=Celeribacter sp. SCSIO 80788 TaxID=3117013 RepID=UPI003DA5CC65